ncbi:hypothetical protein KY284_013310 [Solanum tuberosum]|nr:hypothetical protein KY284_013310 [Solanum tuberosum]
MHYYKLLGRSKSHDSDNSDSENTVNNNNNNNIPAEFLCQAIFAGDSFYDVEAAYGRFEGVVRTATGYYGGTMRKPSYKDVSEGNTGHTEAVKITYDKRFVSYKSLCDFFWDTHDPTNKNSLVKFWVKYASEICYILFNRRREETSTRIKDKAANEA